MPQIGPLEILVVAVIALIVLGPSRLPEMARQAGKTIAALKLQAQELRSEFDMGTDDEDTKAEANGAAGSDVRETEPTRLERKEAS